MFDMAYIGVLHVHEFFVITPDKMAEPIMTILMIIKIVLRKTTMVEIFAECR